MGEHNTDIYGRQAHEVRSIFGDLPIVEAKTDFVVYVNASDITEGVQGDANQCMFSLACKRAFGSQGVLFYPTVAYVDMLDPNDNSRRIVMRFVLPQKTRERLERFDAEQNKGGSKDATFLLKAVPKSATLKQNAKNQRKRQRALRAGKHSISVTRSEGAKKAHATRKQSQLLGIRDGLGKIVTHTKDA